MRPADAGLVEQEARVPCTALGRISQALPDGGRAPVVGHSPTNEAAVLGSTGHVIEPMGKGAGVLITEDQGRYTIESRYPGQAAVRPPDHMRPSSTARAATSPTAASVHRRAPGAWGHAGPWTP